MIDRDSVVGTFRSICSQEAFRAAVAGYIEEGRQGKPSPAIGAFVKDASRPAIVEVFRDLSAAGKMPKLPDSAGHRIELVAAWEAVERGAFDASWGAVDGNLLEIADKFTSAWGMMQVLDCANAVRDGAEFDVEVPAHFAKLLDRVREGNVMMWEARECYDFVDDERYRLEFQDWQPRLVRYDHATNKNVGIEPISVPLFETIEFEFETGDLLVADWFRLEGFDAEFGPEDYSQPSVNSKVGRELETRRHGRHGIVHVYVGGTSPFVFVVDGELVIGGADFDSDNLYLPDLVGAEALGRASTSLRWITVVERHRLADILVRNSGCSPEEAKAKVDAYAGEYGVVSAKIDPGKRTLYYSGDFRDFSGRFKTDELPMPQGLEPYFVISSRELRLSEEQLPAPGPKP